LRENVERFLPGVGGILALSRRTDLATINLGNEKSDNRRIKSGLVLSHEQEVHMKSLIACAVCFSFFVTTGIAADNQSQDNSGTSEASSRPAKQTGSHPRNGAGTHNPNAVPGTGNPNAVPGAHNPNAAPGKARFVNGQPTSNFRRNYPTGLQPRQRETLVMNTPRVLQTNPPKQVSNLPMPVDQSGTIATKPTNRNRPKPRAGNNINPNSYADALKRCRHDRHDRNWWHHHCSTIVFVRTGYYYLDAGYWYPAYGYDPAYDNYYDPDGPIYTYGNLLPDQVIANVQGALREAGYYVGAITGSLNPATRAALANFQRDYGLDITAAVDEATVYALGLI
jgi:hypothetical protein